MRLFISFLFLLSLPLLSLESAIVQVNGKWSDDRYAPTHSVLEHFEMAKATFQKEEWSESARHFMVIAHHFPESPFYGEALYFSGLCFYHLQDFDLANRQISKYLETGSSLQYFEKAFEYKFLIAEGFKAGFRKHLFGWERLPKLFPSRKTALEIYDEVIAVSPSKELAVKALYGKADLLFMQREFEKSIETLTTIVRRFPKHEIAACSYLLLSEIYLAQVKFEPQNPDYISLAKVNLNKMRKHFPAEDGRITKAEQNLKECQEIYASNLCAIAKFYEKKKKPKASLVYYNEAFQKYPQTEGGKRASEKIANGKHIVAK